MLLPSRRLNPDGTRPVTEDNLTGRHRIWVNSMGPLLRADGTEYDKSLISPVFIPAFLRAAAC